MFTLKRTCIQRIPLLRRQAHQNQAILLREVCIKRTLRVTQEGIFMTLWHCYLLRRACLPGNVVILREKVSCRERFAIKHVKYAVKQSGGDVRGQQ